jgi:hypothetical protein
MEKQTITLSDAATFPDNGVIEITGLDGRTELAEYEVVNRRPTVLEFIKGLLHFRIITWVRTNTLNAKPYKGKEVSNG